MAQQGIRALNMPTATESYSRQDQDRTRRLLEQFMREVQARVAAIEADVADHEERIEVLEP